MYQKQNETQFIMATFCSLPFQRSDNIEKCPFRPVVDGIRSTTQIKFLNKTLVNLNGNNEYDVTNVLE